MEVPMDAPPGPNLAAELAAAGLPDRIVWAPNPGGEPGGVLRLPDIPEDRAADVESILAAHVPVVEPAPPSLEERIASLEARVAALEGP